MSDFDITVTGAPESGKSEFVRELQLRLANIGYLDPPITYRLIDGYAEQVAADTDLALGEIAGYVGNLLVMADRLRDEAFLLKRKEPYILVGSIYETIAYMSMHVGRYIRRDDPWRLYSAEVFMKMAGVIMNEFGVTPFIFLKKLPSNADPSLLDFENHLLQALDLYGIHVDIIDPEQSEDEQLDAAVRVIQNRITEAQAAEAEQRGVREGGGSSDEPELALRPMSNVPEQDRVG